MSEEIKISHRTRKRVKDVKRKARPGTLECSNFLFTIFWEGKCFSTSKY